MASTYSDLKIELIGTGEQVGTWGSTTNTNLGTALEEAIVGSADVAFSSADVTITLTNTNGTQAARHLRLNLTGTSGGARNLVLGSGCQIDKPYIINNGLADTVTVKNTTGTGVAVPAGKSMWVYNNGTNVVKVVNSIDLTADASGVLPIANGGTNATATPTAGGVTYGTGSAYAFTSAGTAGQALISDGTGAPTWQNVASTNTAGAIVERDGSGNFSAGTITASLSGNATTATTAAAATQIDIDATTSSDTSTYPVLVGAASTGNQTPFVDTGLSYNASTNALTATTFVGALSGNATTSSSTTGNAATATVLQTARTINGTSFNGSTNITTTNWGTSRNISIGGTSKSVNGSVDVTWTSAEITAVKLSTASGSAPSYSARAWVTFDGTGTPAISASGNVTSITDNGTGDYTVNFTTAMADANYAGVVGAGETTYPDFACIQIPYVTKSTTQTRLRVGNRFNGGVQDCSQIMVSFFR